MVTPVTFGQTLARYRAKAGVSQAELARQTDFDHSYISRLEAGVRTPTRRAVESFSNSLKLKSGDHAVLLAAAGFVPLGSEIVSHKILVEIDSLLDHPNQADDTRRIALDLLAALRSWLTELAKLEALAKEKLGDRKTK